jgi:hypothetical protein
MCWQNQCSLSKGLWQWLIHYTNIMLLSTVWGIFDIYTVQECHLKPTPKTTCILNIISTTDNVQNNISIKFQKQKFDITESCFILAHCYCFITSDPGYLHRKLYTGCVFTSPEYFGCIITGDKIWVVRFQVLMAASMKIKAFWDIAPCSLKVHQCFRSAYCLHHQGDEQAMHKRFAVNIRNSQTKWTLARPMGKGVMIKWGSKSMVEGGWATVRQGERDIMDMARERERKKRNWPLLGPQVGSLGWCLEVNDGGSTHLWNIGLLQRDYTVLYPRDLLATKHGFIISPRHTTRPHGNEVQDSVCWEDADSIWHVHGILLPEFTDNWTIVNTYRLAHRVILDIHVDISVTQPQMLLTEHSMNSSNGNTVSST